MGVGQTVQVQNQTGPYAKKWDLSGKVVEVLDYHSYLVKMDGSGRVSKRNRRFLKPIRTYREILADKDNKRDLREGSGVPAGAQELLDGPVKELGYLRGPRNF